MRLINAGPNRVAIEALDPAPGDTLLELGFGPGEGIAALLRSAPRGVVHGVDQSAAMLRQALRRNAGGVAGERVRLRVGQFTDLAASDSSIDGILAVNVVYFWEDGAAVLGEAWRVLRHGGRMAVYATDAAAMRHWKFAGADTHRLFDRAGLHAFLGQAPFGPEDVEVTQVRLAFGMPGLVALVRKPSEAASVMPCSSRTGGSD